MQEVPLQIAPSQTLKVILGDQNCQLFIYQKPQGLFVDVNADGVDISLGVIALDGVPVACREYAGFRGNLIFIDTQGNEDPQFTGFGTRYVLLYLSEEEYALIH